MTLIISCRHATYLSVSSRDILFATAEAHICTLISRPLFTLNEDPESMHQCIQLGDSVIFQNHTFIVTGIFAQRLYNLLKL